MLIHKLNTPTKHEISKFALEGRYTDPDPHPSPQVLVFFWITEVFFKSLKDIVS